VGLFPVGSVLSMLGVTLFIVCWMKWTVSKQEKLATRVLWDSSLTMVVTRLAAGCGLLCVLRCCKQEITRYVI